MNSPMPANSTISSNLRGDLGALHAHDRALQEDVLAAGQVRMKAGRHFDQRADAARAPGSVPRVGLRMRVSSFRIVDLPAPFGPMMPSACPAPTSNDTSLTAQNSSFCSRVARPPAEHPAPPARESDRAGCRGARRAGTSSRPRRRRSNRCAHLDVLRKLEFGAVEDDPRHDQRHHRHGGDAEQTARGRERRRRMQRRPDNASMIGAIGLRRSSVPSRPPTNSIG